MRRRPVATVATLLSLPALAIAQPAYVAPTAEPVAAVPAYAGPGATPVSPIVAPPPVEPAPELVGIARREKDDPGSDRSLRCRLPVRLQGRGGHAHLRMLYRPRDGSRRRNVGRRRIESRCCLRPVL